MNICGNCTSIRQNLIPFSPKAYALSKIDRRFSWFRRVLKEVDEAFERIFPKHWHMPYRLCSEFLTITRSQILDLMIVGGGEVDDVNVILKVIVRRLICVLC